jgi:cobalamin synthase
MPRSAIRGRAGVLEHIGIIHLWMAQSTEAMALTLTGAFGAFALFLAWLSFASPVTPFVQTLKGVVPPFVGVPATLFGLLMTFLSHDVWEVNGMAYRALAQEHEQLVTLGALSDNHGVDAAALPRAIRDYVEAVVGLEWKAMENGEESPEAESALNTLTRVASSAKIEPAFQRVLIETVMKLRSAREQRLAVAAAYPDDRKWAAVIIIAFITQVSLAVAHLERARPQLLAQAIFGAAAVVAISLVASVVEPYSPPKAVSSDSLEQLLGKLPKE